MPADRLLRGCISDLIQTLAPVPERRQLVEEGAMTRPARRKPNPPSVRLLEVRHPFGEVLQLGPAHGFGQLRPVPRGQAGRLFVSHADTFERVTPAPRRAGPRNPPPSPSP